MKKLVLYLSFCIIIGTASSLDSSTTGQYSDLVSNTSSVHFETCSTGLFQQCKDRNCSCTCRSHYPQKKLTCNGTRSFLLKYNCVTFYKNILSVGFCLRERKNVTTEYELLPKDIHDLNVFMCNSSNRQGTLCGRCLPDHYPLAYSVNMTCVRCADVRWNWLWYIVAAYLPLTGFYVIILVFNIKMTSGYVAIAIFFCQTLSTPYSLRNLFFHLANHTNQNSIVVAKVLLSLYGIWNLDFFRPFYSGFCLGIGIFPTLALDYVIAVYPLLLTIISYLLIVLHDRNYRIITFIWRPFRAVFSLFKRSWDLRTSLVDAFATFFLLSYVKFMSVSFDFLNVMAEFQLYPDKVLRQHPPFLSPDSEYFGNEHRPYAILAIITLLVFVILPVTVLFLYPFSLFQKFLNLFPVRWYILHTFVDSFQGCYKNGTQPGTRDCRWFCSLLFILRLVQYVLISAVPEGTIQYLVVASILVIVLIMFARQQPFKPSFAHLNTISVTFLTFLTFLCISWSALWDSFYMSPRYTKPLILIISFLAMAPVFYATGGFLYIMYQHRGVLVQYLLPRERVVPLPNHSENSELLPDRIENSGRYHRDNLAGFVVQENQVK